MMMKLEEAQLLGITSSDIQEIFQKALEEYNGKISLIFLDSSYLYTFDPKDMDIVSKYCMLGRYDIDAVLGWHNALERWYNDQTVSLGFDICYTTNIKPTAISRSFDRVVNEGMNIIAGAITGNEGVNFPTRAIGDTAASSASPSDDQLGNEIDRINVFETPEGGSLSRNGTTIYSIGNHAKSIPTPANGEFTEVGMFDSMDTANDTMFDHSIFEDPVPHTQNEDAPGSTTVIYMCSA